MRITLAAWMFAAWLTSGEAAERAIGGSDCPAAEGVAAKVAEAVDGETLALEGGRIVRLAGIATPKRQLGLAEKEPSPLAQAAREELVRLAVGRDVRLTLEAVEPDRHGRTHAQVRSGDGLWLQAALVGAGLARVHPGPDARSCIAELLVEERKARAARRGLWSSPDYAIRKAQDLSRSGRNGLYELVEGRVVSVGHGSRVVFVNFGPDFRRDFTIMVEAAVAERFAAAGLPVDDLSGRRIRVRGIVEDSGGPAIRVGDPLEIELLDDGENAGGD